MLNRDKLTKKITAVQDKLFPEPPNNLNAIYQLWQRIACDPLFAARVEAAKEKHNLPTWTGNLNDSYGVTSCKFPYTVLAVDGSQIYPDRTMLGGSCFLINCGGVALSYGEEGSATLFSEPYLFVPEDILPHNAAFSFSKDLVDLKREEFELKKTFEYALSMQTQNRLVCFCDGSLLFWYLETKSPEVRTLFSEIYISYLDRFYQKKISIVGYISLPKSRELVSLLGFELDYRNESDFIDEMSYLVDRHIVNSYVEVGRRTAIFASNAKIVSFYPEHLKPHFFYLNIGQEVVRVEIPAWIAQDSKLVSEICGVILDQCAKGRGYPICLAEAHEQAIVKGADRDFFYHVIQKIGIENQKRIIISQKNLKKRQMSV